MEQSYRNHRQFVPLYHFVTGSILLLNLIWALYRLVRGLPDVPLFDRVLGVLVALALFSIYFYARIFALRVQDRVIRLEMRLRLARLLPPDLQPRIGELSTGQLIGLRFASDEELPELTRKVLDERITKREAIKKMVRRWEADHLRL
ncbi:MAG TPA: DUF6526 family protein [Thermoanaerobaculia bacterium]|nr:DUF6526 family protein [Thermoanaerobaculia bacterium]